MFFYRLMGAVTLDAGMYESIEADRRATVQAAGAVMLSSVAAGVGGSGVYGPSLRTLVVITVVALATWVAWAMLVFHIGSRWLPESGTSVDLGELLRTIGFAATPGILQAAAVFPGLTVAAFVVAWVWMLAAMVVAVKHALDFHSLGRALLVCILAAGLPIVAALGIGVLLGPTLS
jgi:hypothetical protein